MNLNLSRNQKIIAITAGVVIAAVGIFFGFRIISSRASGSAPQNVQTSNVTQNSFRVNWTSATETQCQVLYGTSATALNFQVPELNETLNHQVDVTLLAPETTYHFKIKCGEQEYDNAGVPWTAITKAPETALPSPTPTAIPAKAASPTAALTASPTPAVCTETDCTQVKAKLGKGCTTLDYVKCVKKTTPTP